MQAIDFLNTVWQIIKVFSGNQDKINVRSLNGLRKFFCIYESILLVRKKYISGRIFQNQLPVLSFQHSARHIADHINTAGSPKIFRLPQHIDQGGFSRCTVSENHRNVPSDLKFIVQSVVLYNDSMLPFHLFHLHVSSRNFDKFRHIMDHFTSVQNFCLKFLFSKVHDMTEVNGQVFLLADP